jgi:hypothetical protein
MTSLLDRLETAGPDHRYQDSQDRRARIPALTEAGNRAHHELISARDKAEADALSQFSADEQRGLRAMLHRLAEGRWTTRRHPPHACKRGVGARLLLIRAAGSRARFS